MASLPERWAQLHEQLRADYTTPDGHLADCNQIAMELEELLAATGINPTPLLVFGRPVNENTFSKITPRPYEGRLEWTCHVICAAAGVVYDPMLPEPTPLDVYPEAAFYEEVRTHPILG